MAKTGSNFIPTMAALALSIAVGGCSTVASVKNAVIGGEPAQGRLLTGYIGGAAADEPNAVIIARDVLARGGNAADAATALGFMLPVTLPSRASLGAGGACLAYQPGVDSPNKGAPEAIMFLPVPGGAGGARPAAVPMLARGLYLLSARYGSRPFAEMVGPAEQAARLGHKVSRALVRDIAAVSGPLAGDEQAGALFVPGGVPLAEGQTLIQSDLGGNIAQIRTVGVGDLYQGLLAHKIADASVAVGGGITVDALRASLPSLASPIVQAAGSDQVAFLPAPADGGAAMAAGLQALGRNSADQQGAYVATLNTAAAARGGAGLPALPASTSFVVVDRKGGAVACAISMGNLFGTGRIAPGTGIVLGASPAARPAPLYAAAIAYNANIGAFRAAVAASGQNAAAAAGAITLSSALAGPASPSGPEPGRANVAACGRYLPGDAASCRISADPRGYGLASGG